MHRPVRAPSAQRVLSSPCSSRIPIQPTPRRSSIRSLQLGDQSPAYQGVADDGCCTASVSVPAINAGLFCKTEVWPSARLSRGDSPSSLAWQSCATCKDQTRHPQGLATSGFQAAAELVSGPIVSEVKCPAEVLAPGLYWLYWYAMLHTVALVMLLGYNSDS